MSAVLTPKPRPRLVLITKTGIAVYQGREMLAYSDSDYQYDAAEIEAVRTDDCLPPAEEPK